MSEEILTFWNVMPIDLMEAICEHAEAEVEVNDGKLVNVIFNN